MEIFAIATSATTPYVSRKACYNDHLRALDVELLSSIAEIMPLFGMHMHPNMRSLPAPIITNSLRHLISCACESVTCIGVRRVDVSSLQHC